MTKYSQGTFIPKNPSKLVGKAQPQYRSSWELYMMNFFDQSPSVLQWASESIRIPYKNPFDMRQTKQYVPDFLVLYIDKFGKKHAELIEVKPKKEAILEQAKSKRDKAFLILNSAKWQAAMKYCAKNGLTFRVMTEDDIFASRGKK